ncbi:MAG: alpha-ketoglutarate-dependent dioxygenase AlkB [Microthrixaceae bacterium]|nr:alpha-ketoglutarate-dependent dioxygenase AlkB [Microthrixaceae bacterium]MCB1011274.1 alpha-ketoglutarate-dependent dioxygenase AlkB [Microthrixaceae bacterium]MCO5321839.1 alpha-ketoglutarate-dependent dioxygenase AlkB [Microthrixaceae bacterium]
MSPAAEALQGNLLTAGPAEVRSVAFERIDIAPGSWLEVGRGVLGGADDLLEELVSRTDWRVGRRWMYDREVDDPRLSRWYGFDRGDPHPLLAAVRQNLDRRYRGRLRGGALGGVGLNYYRDGQDSVAFHSDRELTSVEESVVAILVLGQQRPFLVRPRGGGTSLDLSPASGDVVVMGGRCQADFEHAVPKSSRPMGPRVSASWRWSPGATATVHRPGGFFEARRWRSLSG